MAKFNASARLVPLDVDQEIRHEKGNRSIWVINPQ